MLKKSKYISDIPTKPIWGYIFLYYIYILTYFKQYIQHKKSWLVIYNIYKYMIIYYVLMIEYMKNYLQDIAQIISQNVSRCIALILGELAMVWLFHYLEWSLFTRSEAISFGLHFVLSIFGFCVFIIIRNKYIINKRKRYNPIRIISEFVIYILADFMLIHGSIALINWEFHIEIVEILAMATMMYIINMYFDKYNHDCCHKH